jgi:small-conductance mechanosensitive channel
MNVRQLLIGAVLLSMAGTGMFCSAQTPDEGTSIRDIDADLEEVAELEVRIQNLIEDDVSLDELKVLLPPVTELRKTARACIDAESAALDRTRADLEKLGEPATPGDEDAATTVRQVLETEKATRENTLLGCRLLLVKTETLSDRLEAEIAVRHKRFLLARFPGAIAVAMGPDPESLAGMRSLVSHHEQELALPRLDQSWRIAFLMVVAVALGAGLAMHRSTRQPVKTAPPTGSFNESARFAFGRALSLYGGITAAVLVIMLFWAAVSLQLDTFAPELGLSLTALSFLLALLAGRTFLDPVPPARYFLTFEEAASRRFWTATRFLALVWGSAAALYFAPFIQMSLPMALNFRFVYVLLFAAAIGRVVWTFFALAPRKGFGFIRLSVMLVLAASILAETAGYRNLSGFLLQGVMYSLAIISVAWLFGRLTDDLLAGLEDGRHQWQRNFRSWVGIEEDGYLPGVFWLRLLLNLVIIGSVIWFVAAVWGMPEAVRNDILGYFSEGFQVGEVTIVPLRILIAIILLAILFSGLSWLRRRLEESVLSKSRADIGAKNAVSSIGSYIIATLAFLFALSVAGVDLSNLALIAGALSVGIGFGLQNVVNNFVSGLILLFERPIKQGDWIVVGTTEGYVKKISVRSTQITTFDNADVIVPNSELIANQVTNWMLYDMRGRVRVPVGVAYGSDVEKVREILLGIALSHPQTIVDVNIPKPAAIFLSFGDSSLNFELRFHIRNVDHRLSVISDVNFAIEKAFREADITIPFPQTDVHLHYVPGQHEQRESVVTGESPDDLDDSTEDAAAPHDNGAGPD